MDRLLLLCVAISIAGIAALHVFAQFLVPRSISISEVDLLQPGSYVSVAGIVEEVIEREKTFLIKVCDPSACTVATVFKNLVRDPFFFEGDKIILHGVVRDYAGRRYIEIKSSAGIKVLR